MSLVQIWPKIRERRRVLSYRRLVLRQAVQMKNRVSGRLMETGVSYNKLQLHRMGYFEQLLSTNLWHGSETSVQLVPGRASFCVKDAAGRVHQEGKIP
jgi:hypothetical protein